MLGRLARVTASRCQGARLNAVHTVSHVYRQTTNQAARPFLWRRGFKAWPEALNFYEHKRGDRFSALDDAVRPTGSKSPTARMYLEALNELQPVAETTEGGTTSLETIRQYLFSKIDTVRTTRHSFGYYKRHLLNLFPLLGPSLSLLVLDAVTTLDGYDRDFFELFQVHASERIQEWTSWDFIYFIRLYGRDRTLQNELSAGFLDNFCNQLHGTVSCFDWADVEALSFSICDVTEKTEKMELRKLWLSAANLLHDECCTHSLSLDIHTLFELMHAFSKVGVRPCTLGKLTSLRLSCSLNELSTAELASLIRAVEEPGLNMVEAAHMYVENNWREFSVSELSSLLHSIATSGSWSPKFFKTLRNLAPRLAHERLPFCSAQDLAKIMEAYTYCNAAHRPFCAEVVYWVGHTKPFPNECYARIKFCFEVLGLDTLDLERSWRLSGIERREL
eukprot:Colp12_sorted_trinity150504_noHs@18475